MYYDIWSVGIARSVFAESTAYLDCKLRKQQYLPDPVHGVIYCLLIFDVELDDLWW